MNGLNSEDVIEARDNVNRMQAIPAAIKFPKAP
jgi:hypothetical protein